MVKELYINQYMVQPVHTLYMVSMSAVISCTFFAKFCLMRQYCKVINRDAHLELRHGHLESMPRYLALAIGNGKRQGNVGGVQLGACATSDRHFEAND